MESIESFYRKHRGWSASTMHNALSDTEKVEDSVAVEYTRNGNERNFNLNAMQVSVCASHKLVGMLRLQASGLFWYWARRGHTHL